MNTEFHFSPEELDKVKERIVSAFGLAKRAGKCVIGTEMCVENIRAEKAKLVVAANDLSANTVKRLTDSCNFHNVEILFLDFDKLELGAKLGKKNGTSCAAILDDGFVNICRKIYSEVHTENTEVQQ
ncbi:MAG: ribosomal L7Ae/L30e/S12e/Gadd45 family protein [Clostridia bacterium]|nr:ribosomal L7Ae/L30e/S12e/Gadd45 family protein [Clostridia bacterium]